MTPHARFMAAARLYGAPYGVTPEMLLSPTRKSLVVTVRWMLARHCRFIFGWSTLKIGRKLGQDHTTIMHGLRQSEDRIRERLDRLSKPSKHRNARLPILIASAPPLSSLAGPSVAVNDDHPLRRRPFTYEDALRMSCEWGNRKFEEAA